MIIVLMEQEVLQEYTKKDSRIKLMFNEQNLV